MRLSLCVPNTQLSSLRSATKLFSFIQRVRRQHNTRKKSGADTPHVLPHPHPILLVDIPLPPTQEPPVHPLLLHLELYIYIYIHIERENSILTPTFLLFHLLLLLLSGTYCFACSLLSSALGWWLNMELWSTSVDVDDEFEKLVMRMNPPRVTLDNASSQSATLVKVESANKYGSLLQVVQVLTDLNLTINRAYISSDGEWFMDVFYVTDQYGNKLSDLGTVEKIQQSLGARPFGVNSLKRSVGVQPAAEHTTIELIGRDRPGLLSEIFAVLADLKCNVVASEVWTHNSRMASVVYVTDEDTGLPVDDPVRLSTIKQLLRHVLKGEKDKRSAQTALSVGGTHTQRRLHQMLYADRDYDSETSESVQGLVNNRNVPLVTVENCVDKGYTLVTVSSCDRPKLLFDTVCTLTDMQYVVFHARIIVEGAEASQEYYIRHMDGCPVNSEAERRRLIHCLKAAIRRRSSQGLRLELCGEDRVGLLSEVTRIFRENGLSVTQAEVKTRGSKAVNVFYVTDAAGNPVNSQTIEAIRKRIGETILLVKEETPFTKSPSQESGRFSLGNLFRSSSQKFLYNLGLIKSFS